ncbi:MAG: hypothetical protein ACJ75J_11925 [Cytophagaceae bacterium]
MKRAFPLLLFFLFFFQHCVTEKETIVSERKMRKLIDPPFDSVQVSYSKLSVDSKEGKNFTLKSGTRLLIPANAFVDETQKSISGKVDIYFREINTEAELLSSGIPLEFDSAGSISQLQSEKVFEVYGFRNGKPVYINPDTSIAVIFSDLDTLNQNLYRLDTNERRWTFSGKSVMIREKSAALKMLIALPQKPEKPMAYDTSKFTFEFDIDTYYGEYQPELQAFRGRVWQFAGDDPDTDPARNRWIFDVDWPPDLIQFQQIDSAGLKYSISLRSKSKSFQTIVTPVIFDFDYQKEFRKFKEDLYRYEVLRLKREEQRKIAERLNLLYKTFPLGNFGIYSVGSVRRKYKSEPIVIEADFRFKSEPGRVFERMEVFQIIGKGRIDQRTVVTRYSKEDLKNFTYLPQGKNKIIAVIAGSRVGYLSSEEFEKEKIKLKKNKLSKHTFYLNTIDHIKTTQQLDSLIRTL